MTTTTPTVAAATGRPHRPSVLRPATEIVLFGHLVWLGLVWLAATVVYAVVIACVARWGQVDESLWPSVVAGWQRYVIFGAGVTIATTFLRMLVRNGVTRRTASGAASLSMLAIALVVGIWLTAGMALERLVYDAYDWPQALHSGARFTWGDLPRMGLDQALVVAAYYASGWLVGICFYRWRVVGGLLRLLPALLPAALMELVVPPDFGGVQVDVLATWRDRPNLAVTVAVGGALLVATVWVGRRLTVDTSLR